MFSASQRKPPAAGPSTRRSLVGATLKKSGLIDGDAKMSEAGGSRAAGLPARPGARPDGHRKRIFERAKVAEKDQGGMLHPVNTPFQRYVSTDPFVLDNYFYPCYLVQYAYFGLFLRMFSFPRGCLSCWIVFSALLVVVQTTRRSRLRKTTRIRLHLPPVFLNDRRRTSRT